MLFSFAIRFLEVSLVQQTSADIFKHSSHIELIDIVFIHWCDSCSDVVIFSCTTQWLATSRRDLGSSNHLSFGEERMNQQSLFVYKELWDTAGVWTQHCTYGIYCITLYNYIQRVMFLSNNASTQVATSLFLSSVWWIYMCIYMCIYISIYLSLSQRLKKVYSDSQLSSLECITTHLGSEAIDICIVMCVYTNIVICIHIYCNMMYIHVYLYIANIIKQQTPPQKGLQHQHTTQTLIPSRQCPVRSSTRYHGTTHRKFGP